MLSVKTGELAKLKPYAQRATNKETGISMNGLLKYA